MLLRFEKTEIKEEAIKNKKRYYFTGEPCPNGHVARRYISTGACVVCMHDNNLRSLKEIKQVSKIGRHILVDINKIRRIKKTIDKLLEI